MKAVYIPGKSMHVADALSRSPLHVQYSKHEEEEVTAYVNSVTLSWPVPNLELDKIREETQKDGTLE